MSRLVGLAAALVAAAPAAAQNVHPTPPLEVRAVSLQEPIRLDGKLDEAVWRTAPAASDFRQNQPNEGQPATQRTEVRFAYDGAAIYVGARMYDDSGARGVQTRLVRRDGDLNSDYLTVIFDTYHDHIGRLFFTVNPSGVRSDANGLGGGGDDSWDPVWEVKTAIDSLGWTAEMRIPFSQLRYPQTNALQTWGLQIWRQENRLNELSQWSFWHLTESGGPSRFGHLDGLSISRAPGRAELLPYVVGRSSNVPVPIPAIRSRSRMRRMRGWGATRAFCSRRTSPSRRRSTPTSARSKWTPRWSISVPSRRSSRRSGRSSWRAPGTSRSAS